MPLNNPTKSGAAAAGGYAGDNTADRAIPHGLPGVPSLIVIVETVAIDGLGDMAWMICPPQSRIKILRGGANSSLSVSTPTNTDFYIGHATSYLQTANATGTNYRWVAWP